MPAWKVLLIGVSACVCLALALATLLFGVAQQWLWTGGLLAATLAAGGLFALFLRHADSVLDVKVRRARS